VTDLQVGDIIPFKAPPLVPQCIEAWIYGFGFGDGKFSDWKSLPESTDIGFLTNWLDGYICADGTVNPNGTITLYSQNAESLKFVKRIAPMCGFIVTGEHTSKGTKTNLGRRKSTLKRITLSRTGVFKVTQINPLNIKTPVFCAIVPETHQFVLGNGSLTGNCTYLTTGHIKIKDVMTNFTLDKDLMASGNVTMDDIEAIQNELMDDT
jgi:hypothetical protein